MKYDHKSAYEVEEDGKIAHYSMPAGKKTELGVGMEDCKDLVDIIRVM